ncbi:hypothetical protein EMCRGX_G003418 [Ephydatia muelleri]
MPQYMCSVHWVVLHAVACLLNVGTSGAYSVISVPSGLNSTLEGYLCGGLPMSNGAALLLEAGEHVISAGPFCSVSNLKDIAITGAGRDQTIVRCGDGGRGFQFSFIANLTLARMTFVNCGLARNVPSIFVGTISSPVVLYLDSSSVSLQQVTITSFYGIGVFGYAIYNSALSGVQFRNCANDSCSGALLHVTSRTPTVNVRECVFENLKSPDSSGIGSALSLWRLSYKSQAIPVTACVFKNLSTPEGAFVMYKVSSIITNCTFEAQEGGAISTYYSTVYILNSTFSRNFGGAIFTNLNYYLFISGSTFDGNVATEWGGAVTLFQPLSYNSSKYTLNITNCTFINNAAMIGGALFIFDSFMLSTVTIDHTTLQNNSASIGAAIYAADFRSSTGYPTYSLILSDIIVKENHCLSCIEEQEVTGAAIYYTEVSIVIVYGSYSGKGSQFIGNYPEGAMQGLAGGLHLLGNVLFRNNTGDYGGAIGILNNGDLYFYPNCIVTFHDNVARTYGGAIYIEGDPSLPKSKLIQCAMHFIGQIHNYTIIFDSNKALVSGQSIYATPIYNCTLEFPDWENNSNLFIDYPSAYYDHAFNIISTESNASATQILSFPVKVYICECDVGTDCDLSDGYKIFTSPGKTVRFSANSVDSENHTSPAVVFTTIPSNSQELRIGAQQNVQWIGNICDTLEFQIYGKENVSFDLLLSTFMGGVPTVVQVTMRPCDPGFVLTRDADGLLQCNCSSFLTSIQVGCDVGTGTVSRTDNKWIGIYHNGIYNLSAYAYTCPVDYCKSNLTRLSLATSDMLCDYNRRGLLCGQCQDNMSVIFGSSKCQQCSNYSLFTIFMYAALGILLVAFLFMLNVTVTEGTIYGLIFYANVIQVNESIFFNPSFLKPLRIMISFINLDLGFPLCFYDGMDDAAKTGLQFVFPAYLLVLTIAFIVFCHYCLKSNFSGQRLNRFSHFVGKRAVRVLATLIYLSYSKLLRTVIQIFTYTTVRTENGMDFRVWFYDGTIRYLEGKHLYLLIIAMVTSLFFLFPYTLALTLIPIIDKYSDHNRLFTWLHQKANLLKPMNDAYYAPYKGAWRSWLGVRLWLLFILYVPTPIYSSDRPYLLMYIHSILLLVFLFVQAHIKPFVELEVLAGCKMKWFVVDFYNWTDSLYMLNYAILTTTVSYILSTDASIQNLGITVASLVGLSLIMYLVTVLYYITTAIRSICMPVVMNASNDESTIPLSKFPTDNNFETIQYEKSSHISREVHSVSVTENDLREPLMEL